MHACHVMHGSGGRPRPGGRRRSACGPTHFHHLTPPQTPDEPTPTLSGFRRGSRRGAGGARGCSASSAGRGGCVPCCCPTARQHANPFLPPHGQRQASAPALPGGSGGYSGRLGTPRARGRRSKPLGAPPLSRALERAASIVADRRLHSVWPSRHRVPAAEQRDRRSHRPVCARLGRRGVARG